MKMKKILIASGVAFILSFSMALSMHEEEKINGGNYEEWNKIYLDKGTANDVIKTDGGYILVGTTAIYKGEEEDWRAWMMKVDERGNKIWSKMWREEEWSISRWAVAECVLETEEGYIIGGYKGAEDVDFWLIKTDKEGNEIWNKTYDNNGNDDFVNKVIEMADGGYLMVGDSFPKSPSPNIWLVKTDEDGIMQWNKTFGGNDESGRDIIPTGDGYIIVGITGTYATHGGWDVWVIKIDKEGNEIWNKSYGWQDFDEGSSIISTKDGYLIAGGTLSHGLADWDGLLIKIDKEGNEIWNKTYGGGETDGFDKIKKTPDGYILIGCTHTYSVGSFDAWLLKVDKEGNEIWNKSFGGRGDDHARSIIYDNGSYIIAGDIEEKGGRVNAWLIKCGDYPPPKIKIVRPEENYLYIFDRKIMPYDKTLAIGGITIVAESNDPAKIDKVEFYWNGYVYEYTPRAVVYNPPYEWKCRRIGIGAPAEITVAAYYGNSGSAAVDKIEIHLINL